MKKKPTESMFCDSKINFFKTLLWGLIFSFGTISCSKNETTTPTPIVKVEEPKYLEWSYEVGKDPLLIQLFTFPTGLDPIKYFNISDTTKIENIFAGSVSGKDYYGNQRTLDMTKNSWNNQIFPNVPVKVGGYEFPVEIRDELFKGVLITNVAGNWITDWANKNLVKIYNEKLKPQLDKKNDAYFKVFKKKPKYQISVIVLPREYYASGPNGTIVTMSDGNKVVFAVVDPWGEGKLHSYLSMFNFLGHEFAGHGLTLGKNLLFKDYIGKRDQFDNSIDGSGHVNGKLPVFIFSATIGNLLSCDSDESMLFPQENIEYYSAYNKDFNPSKDDYKTCYGNLKLRKTSSEKSNIPYIADLVKNTQDEAEKFMKEMWTDKVLKGGRTATNMEYVTIKSIISCQ
jgi:hypothetical protein